MKGKGAQIPPNKTFNSGERTAGVLKGLIKPALPPYIRRAKQHSKGGDPVSHCHDLRLKGAATWIVASGEVRVA
jgi:hypothetical protein